MGGGRHKRAWDVHVTDVSSADAYGRCTVSVYDPPNDTHTDVIVSYLPESNAVEIDSTCPMQRYGSRVVMFVESDDEVRELVGARFREGLKFHDPR